MWEILARLALIAGLLGLFGAVLRSSFARSRERVVLWARENGFELSRCEWQFGGRELQLALRVVDREGRSRDGWVRCGGPLIGMMSRRVEVRWVSEGRSPSPRGKTLPS